MTRQLSRLFVRSCLVASILGLSASANAQGAASEPVDLNQDIVPTTPGVTPPPSATGGPVTPVTNTLPPAEWNADDFDVHKPQLNLLEIDGYFRVRPDLLFNGHLGNDAPGLAFSRIDPATYPRDNTLAGANMRMRITPTLNVTEDIQLVATFDVFDNLVLGSTPNTLAGRGTPVVNILEVGQASPQAGLNAVRDAVQVRRLYGKVATPIGELRFGRQPNKWGLGMYANEGDCIDCDHGDNVDRISFVGMLGSYYIVPMIDFMAEGPTSAQYAQPYSYARDIDQLDDATQYSLQVARKDSPEDIKEAIERGEVVFNWGAWAITRFQSRENPRYYFDPYAPFDPNNPTLITRQARDAFAVAGDGWFKLQWNKLTVEAEGFLLYAQFKLPDPTLTTGNDVTSRNNNLIMNTALQGGAALDARFDILPELYVRLRAGVASGDTAPGFGIGQNAYAKRGNTANNNNDTTLNNFQFNRDYRVDLILFRELLGTVSGSWYLKPEVSYTFSNGLGASFAPMYAQAIYRNSTPAQNGTPLGFELDFEAFYAPHRVPNAKAKRGFDASIQYGLFIPLADSLANPTTGVAPGIAHRIIGRMAILF